jgi:hypothetical protein
MENLIKSTDLIKLGFGKAEEGEFVINNNFNSLTLKKHNDVINWYVIYDRHLLFITSFTIEKIKCLLVGLGFANL